jgi:integrase
MSKSISKKGSPYRHYDFTINGHRFFGSTGLRHKREADSFVDRLRQEILLPDIKRPPITLDEACGLYADHAETLTSWSTTRYMLKAIVHGLDKDAFLSQITQRNLIGYVAARRFGRSNSSVNREIDCLCALWNRANAARFDVGEMPNWKSLRLKTPKLTHRVLGDDEQDAYLAAIRDDVRDCVRFLLLSGWRRAEVLGLRWADVDFSELTALTRIKGGDIVTRPITGAMRLLIANQPKVGPFIFTYLCERTGNGTRLKGVRYSMTVTVLRSAWEAAREKGLSDGTLRSSIRIHDLRHTRATRMLRATGNLGAVKAALQHRSINTTLKYAHVLDDDVRNGLAVSETRTITAIPKRKTGKS